MIETCFFINKEKTISACNILLNVFSDDFLQKNEIKEIELHYMGESREGELLEIFHKQVDDSTHFCQIRCGERKVFEMSILF